MPEPFARLVIEPTSAIICFILVWYMAKPYRLTGKASFLGLPLGFGIMGISHVIATSVAFSRDLSWLMLLFRTFSFAFLATVYLFSSRSSKKIQQLWNISISAIIVTLIALSLLLFIAPQNIWQNFDAAQIYYRVFMLIFLCYIIFYTFRTHVKAPDPMTIWIPFGFIFLAISQYSFFIWSFDFTDAALWGGFVFRLAGLSIFLVVAYRTFNNSKEVGNVKDPQR